MTNSVMLISLQGLTMAHRKAIPYAVESAKIGAAIRANAKQFMVLSSSAVATTLGGGEAAV